MCRHILREHEAHVGAYRKAQSSGRALGCLTAEDLLVLGVIASFARCPRCEGWDATRNRWPREVPDKKTGEVVRTEYWREREAAISREAMARKLGHATKPKSDKRTEAGGTRSAVRRLEKRLREATGGRVSIRVPGHKARSGHAMMYRYPSGADWDALCGTGTMQAIDAAGGVPHSGSYGLAKRRESLAQGGTVTARELRETLDRVRRGQPLTREHDTARAALLAGRYITGEGGRLSCTGELPERPQDWTGEREKHALAAGGWQVATT